MSYKRLRSANDKTLFMTIRHQLSKMEEKGRNVDIHKKVQHAFPHKNVRVTAELESPCCSVHLRCLHDVSNHDEQTHQCVERVHNFSPQARTELWRTERKLRYLNGNHYMIGTTTNVLL